MPASSIDSLLSLHEAFWNRELDRPIISLDHSFHRRFAHLPALPSAWEDRDDFILEPAMLSPEEFQPPPIIVYPETPSRGEVAFNALFPYHRIPWLPGIVGCDLRVSRSSKTIWPVPYLADNWYEMPNEGFAPRLEWLDKLLEFLSYIVDRYNPDRCLPAQDTIVRGPGDLLVQMFGGQRCYLEFYDHPGEVKLLIGQICDLYIHWAKSQLERIPRFHGGYCTQYGIWCPGTFIRFQEDLAINLSPRIYEEFLAPCHRKLIDAFEYHVVHTHSGFPQLAEWTLRLDGLRAIEVSLDGIGPSVEELIRLWNRILEEKCLILSGPVTERQLDLILSSLSPRGLWLDIFMIPEEYVGHVVDFAIDDGARN